MRSKLIGFIVGVLMTTFFFTTLPSSAADIKENIQVFLNRFNVTINGIEVGEPDEDYQLSNGDMVPLTIVYKGTTYMPLRKVSEILGKDVGWDGETQTVSVNDMDYVSSVCDVDGVFKGFFNNADYSSPELFAVSGEQTATTSLVKSIADNFNDNKDISTMKEIYSWLRNNLEYGEGEKFSRTSHQIFDEDMFTGCTDMGLAFASLSREKGIPTVFVQTGRIDWIEEVVTSTGDPRSIRGHIFVEVLLDDGVWYLIDSTAGKLYYDYDKNRMSLPDGYYVHSKSIEVWDTGILDEADNHASMLDLYKDFDVDRYSDPGYKYLDLYSGREAESQEFTGVSLDSVILGDKEPVEAYADKFHASGSKKMASPLLVTESQVKNAKNLVFLYVKGSSYPEWLVEYFDRLTDPGLESGIYRESLDGQERVLIVGGSNGELLEIVGGM